MIALDMTPLNAALSHWITAIEVISIVVISALYITIKRSCKA
jgi:hypothetical protein